MKTLLTTLALVAVTLLSARASACDEGDALVGPNCIHTESTETRYGTSQETDVWTEAVAYRVIDGERVIVWEGSGAVSQSTPEVIQTVMYNRGKRYVDTYGWNGSEYVKK